MIDVIAELWLLLRDSLLFEDGDRLVLFAGLPPQWLQGKEPLAVENAPTWFGAVSVTYAATAGGAKLSLGGAASPPGGLVLRLPPSLEASTILGGKRLVQDANGDLVLPPGTKQAAIAFSSR